MLLFHKNKDNNKLKENPEKNEYKESLQQETRLDMEKFKNMTQEQIENEILIFVGVSKALINNPRTRALLVRKMKTVGMPDFTIEVGNGINIISSSGTNIEEQNLMQYIKNAIQEEWKVYEDAVELPKEEKDGFAERTILKSGEKNIVIEKKRKVEGNDENQWYHHNITCTYNSDGLEVKHEEAKKGCWNNQKLSMHQTIVREDIDKATLTLDGDNYLIDLAYYPESMDIADLHAIVAYSKHQTQIDNLYPDLSDEELKEEHELEVKKKIKESKYANACFRYVEKKNGEKEL